MIIQSQPYSPQDLLASEVAASDGIIQSIVAGQQPGMILPGAFGENMQEMAIEAERLALQELNAFEFEAIPIFRRRNAVHRENINYFQSHQWSENDITTIIEDGRKPYSFNLIRRFFQTLLGEQRSQRTEWRAIPMNKRSGMKVDVYNHLLRWAGQNNDFYDVASDVFRDGVIGGVGVIGVDLDVHNPFGAIKIDRQYPLEFMWDLQTAKNGYLDNCKYVWRGCYIDREVALNEFPEWADEINLWRGASYGDNYFYGYETLIRPKIAATAADMTGPYEYNPRFYAMYRNQLFKREFYRRRYVKKWLVHDGVSNMTQYFDDEQKALEWAQKLYAFYSEPAIMAQFQIRQPYVSAPYWQDVAYVDQMIFLDNRLVRVNTSKVDRLPYKFYIPEWYDGDMTSYFEHGKGYQRLINRYMMFQDQMAGGVKGSTVINEFYANGKYTSQQLREVAVSANPTYLINMPDKDAAVGLINNIPPPNFGPAMSVLSDAVTRDLSQMYGGQNYIGQQAFAGQSGRSAQGLASQATVATIPLYDKWRKVQKQVGQDIIYLSQFLSPQLQMVVVDEMNNPEFRSFIDDGIQNPEDFTYDVFVSEVVKSATEQEATLNRLMVVAQTNPELAQDMTEVFLDNVDIDASIKKKILENRDARIAYERQLEQQQIQLKQDENNIKRQRDYAANELKNKELQLEAMNLPKVSMVIKPEETAPGLLAEIMNKAGVPADPIGVAADKAFDTIMRQEALNLQQKSRNDLLLPEEREGLKNKAKQPYKNVPSAADSAERKS